MDCERCDKPGAIYFTEIYDPLYNKHMTYCLCFECCRVFYIRSREWLQEGSA